MAIATRKVTPQSIARGFRLYWTDKKRWVKVLRVNATTIICQVEGVPGSYVSLRYDEVTRP